MNVLSFMLSNGQELIAELVAETGQGYRIRRPLRVAVMQGQGGVQIGFALWSMIQDHQAPVELFDHALLCQPVAVDREVADSYIQQVSGIVVTNVAPSSPILQG